MVNVWTELFLNKEFFSHLVIWTSHILFWIALLPQVALNFKLKSTRGLSDLMLVGYFNGYIAYVTYTFCLGLPLAYKVMISTCLITMLVMVFQRFWYERRYKTDKGLLVFYVANGLVVVALIPLIYKYMLLVGHIAGWIMAFIWGVYQIPQIIKIYRSKSIDARIKKLP